MPASRTSQARIIIVDPRRTVTVNACEVGGRQGPRAAPRHQFRHRPRAVQCAAHLHRRPGLDRQGLHRRLDQATSTRRSPANKTSSRRRREITGLTVDHISQGGGVDRAAQGGGARRRTMFAYEKGLIWGNDNYRTNARAGERRARHRQYRPAGRRLRAHGRPPGRLCAPVRRACRAARGLCRPAPDRGQGRRPSHLGLRPLQDDAQRASVQAPLQEADRHGEGRHVGVPYGDRAAMVDAIMEAIREGGLFAVDVDIVPTKIGQACHVWLPAATSGEMNLTSMNGERRMRLTERYMDPPGQAMPDCLIAARIANHMERVFREKGKDARTPTSSRASTGRPKKTPSWTATTQHAERRRVRHLRAPARHGHQRLPGAGHRLRERQDRRHQAPLRRRQIRRQGRQGHVLGDAVARPAGRRQAGGEGQVRLPDQQRPHQPRLAERLSRSAERVRHGPLAVSLHRDEPGRHGRSSA